MLIGLASCGDPTEPAASTPEPAIIQIAGAAGNAAGGSATADAAVPASAESTKMMAAYIEFLYSGDITDLTAPAASWFFDPNTVPTADQIASLAAALGVEGEVHELGADMGGGWLVGSPDYTGESVTVSPDALQSWWYNPGYTETMAMPACEYPVDAVSVESAPPDATTQELYPPGDPAGDFSDAPIAPCPQPEPPVNVPTADEAKAMTIAMFEAMGIAVDSYDFETYADEWSANVTGYLTLDGVRTNVSISAGYGAEGVLSWASGFLATPQRGDDYPRIGIDAAVQRLNDQQGMIYPMARGANDVGYAEAGQASTGAGVATATAVVDEAEQAPLPSDVPAVCDPAADCVVETVPGEVPVDTMPVEVPIGTIPFETMPVEPFVVTLTNAHASLEQVWAADETVWLLPGYAFDSTDGGMYSVIAIDDKFMEVAEPLPVPAPLPVESSPVVEPPASIEPQPPVPGSSPDVADIEEVAKLVVGLTEAEATDVATANGWTLRVGRQDGVDLALTMDYSPTRFNIAVDNGVVTEVISQG
jgi:hypothetical protein